MVFVLKGVRNRGENRFCRSELTPWGSKGGPDAPMRRHKRNILTCIPAGSCRCVLSTPRASFPLWWVQSPLSARVAARFCGNRTASARRGSGHLSLAAKKQGLDLPYTGIYRVKSCYVFRPSLHHGLAASSVNGQRRKVSLNL